eukprot:CAMPEP_0182802366 /NCGR_PEP_ID=MMETSP0006_2-20121128/3442_1 /TAXON_ID=97485 /ORGANISM="Prymnesium parvum, Strain Texoma1" /LENGTH=67 /DNA_ID=CAMNT_0024927739 /DNA_START=510 /DNA_END=710 /DNA_ORIENTATION=+
MGSTSKNEIAPHAAPKEVQYAAAYVPRNTSPCSRHESFIVCQRVFGGGLGSTVHLDRASTRFGACAP